MVTQPGIWEKNSWDVRSSALYQLTHPWKTLNPTAYGKKQNINYVELLRLQNTTILYSFVLPSYYGSKMRVKIIKSNSVKFLCLANMLLKAKFWICHHCSKGLSLPQVDRIPYCSVITYMLMCNMLNDINDKQKSIKIT